MTFQWECRTCGQTGSARVGAPISDAAAIVLCVTAHGQQQPCERIDVAVQQHAPTVFVTLADSDGRGPFHMTIRQDQANKLISTVSEIREYFPNAVPDWIRLTVRDSLTEK